MLKSLQLSFSKEIDEIENSTLASLLRIKGKDVEEDYYTSEWWCGACGEEFRQGEGRYFNSNGDGCEFCNICLDIEFSKLFKRPTKKTHRYCSICETRLPEEKPFAFQSKKNNDINICSRCVNDPNEAKKGLASAKKIIDKELTKLETAKQKQIAILKSAETIAQTYIEAGLGEAFALAIGKGVDPDEVLTLWEAEWWKQYPDDDPLLVSVLDGKFSEDDARYINNIRSDHSTLALCCINEKVTVDWARALLDSGFEKYPESVEIILKGADPAIISRLHKIDCNSEMMPPKLETPAVDLKKNDNTN